MTLNDVKTALRVKTTAYDTEIESLIASALIDLGIAGVEISSVDDVIQTAVITYCKLRFLRLSDADYRNLERSYNEQKAQLTTATGYTDWGGIDE